MSPKPEWRKYLEQYLIDTGWSYRQLAERLAELPCKHRPRCDGACHLYSVHYTSLYKYLHHDDRGVGLEGALKLERGTTLLRQLGITKVRALQAAKLCSKAVASPAA